MARKVKVKDTDKGWRRIKREIAKARRKPHVQVGIFGAAALADHGGKRNIEIAAVHEFGASIDHPGGTAYFVDADGEAHFVSNAAATDNMPRTKPHKINVPERSFLRSTFDAKARVIARMARELQARVLEGKLDTRKALEQLGLYVKGQVQSRISRGVPPPLRPSTVRRKGSSTPLIATGQLRASIDHKVNNA